MNTLSTVLNFLARPWIWFTVVALILIYTGVVQANEVTGLLKDMMGAVKDWNPLGG